MIKEKILSKTNVGGLRVTTFVFTKKETMVLKGTHDDVYDEIHNLPLCHYHMIFHRVEGKHSVWRINKYKTEEGQPIELKYIQKSKTKNGQFPYRASPLIDNNIIPERPKWCLILNDKIIHTWRKLPKTYIKQFENIGI